MLLEVLRKSQLNFTERKNGKAVGFSDLVFSKNMDTSELIKEYIEIYRAPAGSYSSHGSTRKYLPGYNVTYQDDYGFEIENPKNGFKLVFRPDIPDCYMIVNKVRYDYNHPLFTKIFSRYKNKMPLVNNLNFDGDVSDFLIFINHHFEDFKKLFPHNFISGRNIQLFASVKNVIMDFIADHINLIQWLYDNTSIRSCKRFNDTFLEMFYCLYQKFGEDTARYFALAYNKSSVTLSSYGLTEDSAFFDYIHDPRRTIDYLLFELYTQGMEHVHIDNYINYLKFKNSDPGAEKVFPSNYPSNLSSALLREKIWRPKNIFYNYAGSRTEEYYGDYVIRLSVISDKIKNVPLFENCYVLLDKNGEKCAFFELEYMIPLKELTEEESDIIKSWQEHYKV